MYTLIHIPLDEQPALIQRLGRWLRPGGWLIATVGYQALTSVEDDWLGGGAPMRWSQTDADTYRIWLGAAGFEIVTEDFVPEGEGGHVLFWCRSPS